MADKERNLKEIEVTIVATEHFTVMINQDDIDLMYAEEGEATAQTVRDFAIRVFEDPGADRFDVGYDVRIDHDFDREPLTATPDHDL